MEHLETTEIEKGLCSVCCLGYKHKDYITDCFKSILNQEYKNIEIIAMDDGSDDGSEEQLEKLSQKYPEKIKILHQKNTGKIGYNINRLIKEAKGEFILTLAFDDMITQDCISSKIYQMLEDKNIQFITNSNVLNIKNGNTEVVEYPLGNIESPSAKDLLKLDFENLHSYYIQGTLFRKSIIVKAGYFDEDMLADDIVLRTKIAKVLEKNPDYKFLVLKTPGLFYRTHNSNISGDTFRQLKSVTQWLDKYYKDTKNPSYLYEWYKHFVRNYKLSQILQTVKIKRLRPYLKNKEILQILTTRLLKNIFLITNKYKNDKKYKHITILGKTIDISIKEKKHAIRV